MLENNKLTIQLSQKQTHDVIFILIYSIWLFFSILSTSFYYVYFYNYFKYINYVCVLTLCLGEFIYGKYKMKDFISGIMFFCVAVFLIRYNYLSLYVMMFFIFFSRNTEFEKNAKAAEMVSLFTLIFIILSSYFGIITNYVFSGNTERIRECIGFRYPLYSSAVLCNIITMCLCADKENIKWKKIFFYLMFSIWIFSKSKSRLSFLISIFLLLYSVITKLKIYELKKNKSICYVLIFLFILSLVLSLYISYGYQGNIPIYKKLNTILSNRLMLQNSAIKRYGITAFGQNITLNGWGLGLNGENMMSKYGYKYNYIDNAYIQLLIIRGWIFTALFVALLTYTSYKAYKEGRYVLLFAMAALAIRFFIDDSGLQLYYNGLWLAVSKYIFSNSYENHSKHLIVGERSELKQSPAI